MNRPAAGACALWIAFCVLGASAAAQETSGPPPMTDKAPVVLDGRLLFEVGESGTWSPTQRAAEINRILRAAAADPEPVNLVLAEHDGYPTIRMGEWHLLSVTDSDVVPGMDAGEQAQRWLMIVEEALVRARQERSPAYRLGAALRIGAALLGALLVQAALSWLRRRLFRRRSWQAPPSSGFKTGWQLTVELTCAALQVSAWIAAVLYGLNQFPASRQLRFVGTRVLEDSLRAPLFTLNERAYSAIDLLWLAGAFALLWFAVSLVTWLLSLRLMRATGVAHGALQPVATLLKYALTFVGLIVILQLAGINLSSLALLASVLGVGIGFGLQSIANNFVSGVIMSFEQPVKPGDFISLGTLHGTVQRIGARSTVIRTRDRVSIIVPNARVLEQDVVNWSYGDELARLHVPVGVAYGSDVDLVRGALLEAASSHPAVLDEPRPDVHLRGFGDSALNFELLVWSRDPPGLEVLLSDLNYQIEAALRRAGIEIPFPQRTLHVSADEIGAIVERVNGAPASPPHAAPARVAPKPVQPAAVPAPSRALGIDALVARMRGPGGLAIEDRRHRFLVYPKCFVGSEAVAWLMQTNALTREEAVRLGQSLVDRGVIHHVLDEHPFEDGNYFYRFYADEAPA